MTDKLNEIEYRVLARKYRPQTFKDLIGQDILVRSLINSISQNRIAHAYILTGVRGIGKTTAARLIAMSLNCENRTDETFEPCGKCNSCIDVREDRSLDVIEMDAASKTGVDDIREIIDNIKYKPVSNLYKIFIIDEVHMLSKNAFNALLKTLEEPPSHIKFIFATTEVKKIPITIISRCQRFDLQRIDKEKLTSHLLYICEIEKIEIDNDAIALLVRSADGSMRDGLSLLDQAIVNENGKITAASIILMLGLADRGNIFDLIEAIFDGNAPNALKIYEKIYSSGADVLMIFDEILNLVHFITQIKIVPELKDDIHIPELERLKGYEISEKISMSSLGLVWQILFKGYEELQFGYHLFQHGEMIIIRLIYVHQGPSPEDLLKKIKDDEPNQIKQSEKSNISNNRDQSKIIINHIEENKTKIDLNKKEVKDHKNSQGLVHINSFRQFVDLFYKKREAMLHTYLYNNVKLVSFKEGEVTVNIQSILDPHFTRTIAKLVSTWTGRIWQVHSSTSNIGQSLFAEDLVEHQREIEKMNKDTLIKSILDEFPGSKIHSITKIKETIETIETNELEIEINKIKEK